MGLQGRQTGDTEINKCTSAVLGAAAEMPRRKHFRYRLDYRRPRSIFHYDHLISELIVWETVLSKY